MDWRLGDTKGLIGLFDMFTTIHMENKKAGNEWLVTLAITKQDLLDLIEDPCFLSYTEITIPSLNGRLRVTSEEQKELPSYTYDFRGRR